VLLRVIGNSFFSAGSRLSGDQRNVSQLLAGVLECLINQAHLLPHAEAQPVRADHSQAGRHAKLASLQNDDPPAILPINQLDDLSLLWPRMNLMIAPSRVRIE
jgi:hypothetical protein